MTGAVEGSCDVTPYGKPFEPTVTSVSREDQAITVRWTPPGPRSDGTPGDNGREIDEYEARAYRVNDPGNPNDDTLVGEATLENPDPGLAELSIRVDGKDGVRLANGEKHYATVRAHNIAGWSEESAASELVTPAGLPTAPASAAAVEGDTSAQVTWPAADFNGGVPLSYTVHAVPGPAKATVSPTETSAVVHGLKNGTDYRFSVTAKSDVGSSPTGSPLSNQVRPYGVPFAPGHVGADSGDQEASIRWTAPPTQPDGTPGDNGESIDEYVVGGVPANAVVTITGNEAHITGLDNNSVYQVTVAGRNLRGLGAVTTYWVIPSDTQMPAEVEILPNIAEEAISGGEYPGGARVKWSGHEGEPVLFEVVLGPNQGVTGECVAAPTSHGGCYIDPQWGAHWQYSTSAHTWGSDVLKITIDSDDDGVRDAGEPVTTLSYTWLKPARYVALGDSFVAGEGQDPYFADYGRSCPDNPNTSPDVCSTVDFSTGEEIVSTEGNAPGPNLCHRSSKAYPSRVLLPGYAGTIWQESGPGDTEAELDFRACSSAVIGNLFIDGDGQHGEVSQNFGLTVDTDMVTVSIGGNDMEFVDVLKFCALPTHFTCLDDEFRGKPLRDWLRDTANNLADDYDDLFTEIRDRVSPGTTLIALGYPHLFYSEEDGGDQECDLGDFFTATETEEFNEWTSHFNRVIDAAATRHGFHFVDLEKVYRRHEICGEEDDWLNFIVPLELNASVHPRQPGHEATAEAIEDLLRDLNRTTPRNRAGLPQSPLPPS